MKGILFDVYGTLIEIETDEHWEEVYRTIAHYLTYEGIYMHRFEVRDLYFQIVQQRLDASREEYPEVDQVAVWGEFLSRRSAAATAQTRLPLFLACLHRGVARKRLRTNQNVTRVLEALRHRYILGIVSDAQAVYVRSEMQALGLLPFFDHLVISSEYGFRKPDRRLFESALQKISLQPDEVLFVGNDTFRDIVGGRRAGIKTVLLRTDRATGEHQDVYPDFVIHDFEELLALVGSAEECR
ncbi:MAG: HAD family hydrolase [Peptococcaceae bacterium]|nr:HAD family hydrolase [Peptococcaceae bacterium]